MSADLDCNAWKWLVGRCTPSNRLYSRTEKDRILFYVLVETFLGSFHFFSALELNVSGNSWIVVVSLTMENGKILSLSLHKYDIYTDGRTLALLIFSIATIENGTNWNIRNAEC